jgi:hypothetical protein
MGDRANIIIQYEGGQQIFFYTHWNGYRLPDLLKEALVQGRSRWDDPSYLARIIFCAMVHDANDSRTGFGISPRLTDNEHDFLIVDTVNNLVGISETTDLSAAHTTFSFDGFCSLPGKGWDGMFVAKAA